MEEIPLVRTVEAEAEWVHVVKSAQPVAFPQVQVRATLGVTQIRAAVADGAPWVGKQAGYYMSD